MPASLRSRLGFRRPGAFRHYNFRLYWTGQLVSLIGTHMQRAAQAWLVLTLTDDPFMLGLLVSAQFGPLLVFGLLGGVAVDTLPKRATIITTQVVAMVLAFLLGFLVATGSAEVWHVLLLAFLLGLTNVVDIPARQSFVIEMVGRDDIVSAVAMNSTLVHTAKVIGPAVAGVTISAVGLSTAFIVNGVSFAAVLAGLFAMRTAELQPAVLGVRPGTPRAVLGNLAEGLQYAFRTRDVILAVVLVGLVTAAGMNFQVLLPPLARDVLRSGATGYGFLMAASGIGAVCAALLVAFRGRPRDPFIPAAAVVLGLVEIVLGSSGSMLVACASMIVIGFAGVIITTFTNTLIQTTVPDQLRGRVMAFYVTIHGGATPVGGVVFGAIAAAIGPPLALVIGGLSAAAVGLLVLVAGRTARSQQVAETSVTGP